MELAELMKRHSRPSDVQELLCGPAWEELPRQSSEVQNAGGGKRNTGAFVNIVELIMVAK